MTHVVDRVVVPKVNSAGDDGVPRAADGAPHLPRTTGLGPELAQYASHP